MKRMWTTIAGTALAVVMGVGTAGAGEQFQTLAGIQAAAMSQSEMATVEGKGPNALGAIAILGEKGFLAFVDGKRSNPIVTYDANALNPDATGVVTAVGILDPLLGLFSFRSGDRDAPVLLIDLTSITNPPSGQATFLGLPDLAGIFGLLELSGGGSGLLGDEGVLSILSLGGGNGLLGILDLGGSGGVLNILDLGGSGGLLGILDLGGSGGILSILDLGGSGGVLGILGGGSGGILNILNLGGSGGILNILNLGGSGGGVLGILPVGGLLTGLPILSGL